VYPFRLAERDPRMPENEPTPEFWSNILERPRSGKSARNPKGVAQ